MEISKITQVVLFALLTMLLVSTGGNVQEGTKSHGVWRGELTTVTAKGGMLATSSGVFWVSDIMLAESSLKGDSAIVIGYRSGRFISPFKTRIKHSESIFSTIRRRYRARLISTIRNRASRGLTGGLLMGLRGMITDETAQAFRNSGTSHLLALSGLHTGIIALVLLFAMRSIFGKGIYSGWAAVVGIILFVTLSGSRASTIRSGIMASTAILWMTYRGGKLHLLSLWWATLTISLIFFPATLTDKGAQMSYGAILALIFFGKNFKGRFSVVFSTIYAGIVVTISLAPLITSIYGGFAWLGPVATVISIPFMLIVMGSGLISSIGLSPASVVLEVIANLWIQILQAFSHTALSLPALVLLPIWINLIVILRVFAGWNGFNRRFR